METMDDLLGKIFPQLFPLPQPSNATISGIGGTADPQLGTRGASAPTKPTFLTLPREVRLEILRLLLIIDSPINPYPAYFYASLKVRPGLSLPQASLLQVCRSIHDEAAILLYGGNTWILDVQSLALSVNDGGLSALFDREWTQSTFWKTKSHLINNVMTTYHLLDVIPQHLAFISQWTADEMGVSDDDDESRRDFADRVNEDRDRLQLWTWEAKLKVLKQCNLKTLRIDFDHCYFPSGHDRRRALKAISSGLKAPSTLTYTESLDAESGNISVRPTRVTITGLKSPLEEELFMGPERWTIVNEVDDSDEEDASSEETAQS